jgi:acyl-CoA synthetase (AMP-forming)/AMP-acid ligase II
MNGYWHRAEDSERALSPEGWLSTGDIGYLDEDGYVFLTDRLDDMIVTRSVNVYPAEVENVLQEYPGIKELAIIGVPDDVDGQAICALVVPDNINFDDRDFVQWAKSKVADYKLPRTVRFLEELPRNPAGKILRRQLREPFWKGREREI